MNLRKFLLMRAWQILVTFFIVLTLLFVLFRMAPGDPVAIMTDPLMTEEEVQILKTQFGLDQPLHRQYLLYLWNFLRGEFGQSFHYRQPVVEILADRLPKTVLLFTTATILYATAGIALGKILAWRRGSLLDTGMSFLGLLTHTFFLPWLALLLVWIFGYNLGWFPLSGILSPELWLDPESGFLAKLLDILHHMILPMGVLFLTHFGGYTLVMRSTMLETLREDYILTARAKGLPEKVIRNHHAAPNASLPVVTSLGLSLAFSINGGAITETIFSWPGLGRELVSSVAHGDYPLAQAAFLLIAAFVLVANLVVDLIYAYLDPRIRY
ncbi:MAG: ABC transporter permease [Thermodesulfobacteriota bacterium]